MQQLNRYKLWLRHRPLHVIDGSDNPSPSSSEKFKLIPFTSTSTHTYIYIYRIMLSLRSFARVAPRSISRLAQPHLIARTPIFASKIQPSIQAWTAPFSTTPARKEGNEELVAKLKAEYDIETSDFDEAPINETVQAFIKDSPFEIHDTPGIEDVVLTRKYNNEKYVPRSHLHLSLV